MNDKKCETCYYDTDRILSDCSNNPIDRQEIACDQCGDELSHYRELTGIEPQEKTGLDELRNLCTIYDSISSTTILKLLKEQE